MAKAARRRAEGGSPEGQHAASAARKTPATAESPDGKEKWASCPLWYLEMTVVNARYRGVSLSAARSLFAGRGRWKSPLSKKVQNIVNAQPR